MPYLYWLWFAIGVFIGSITTSIIFYARSSGTLKIDRTNPEKDVYRFEIDDLDSLHKKKRIVLKIDNDAAISHE